MDIKVALKLNEKNEDYTSILFTTDSHLWIYENKGKRIDLRPCERPSVLLKINGHGFKVVSTTICNQQK